MWSACTCLYPNAQIDGFEVNTIGSKGQAVSIHKMLKCKTFLMEDPPTKPSGKDRGKPHGCLSLGSSSSNATSTPRSNYPNSRPGSKHPSMKHSRKKTYDNNKHLTFKIPYLQYASSKHPISKPSLKPRPQSSTSISSSKYPR